MLQLLIDQPPPNAAWMLVLLEDLSHSISMALAALNQAGQVRHSSQRGARSTTASVGKTPKKALNATLQFLDVK